MQRDLYGLALSTTAEAASAYNTALGRILRVQAGADEAMCDAVRLDPGFALAHAGLALLGHEYGAHVDVEAALAAADRSLRGCTDRERSQVGAVAARVRDGGARQIIDHLNAHPRDALMLNVAVPTIAFAGATELPEDAWALVEGLAPAYGDDWWYAGLLAFIRQEQERWAEAAALSERALDLEPASGHAAHARAHVYYETGDHAEGLRWLDGWIATAGLGAHHRVHFSWHAALHELADGDAAAVRRRYHDQIAPPQVTGMRLLVDSASLLWRGALDDVWKVPAPIGPVLDGLHPRLFARPPTPFAALHAAIALATAGDVVGLARLHRYALAAAGTVFPTVVAPLVGGFMAYTEGRFDAAATALIAVQPMLIRVGGSAAQREVVEDTLVHALLGAGRLSEARGALVRRLDRRPSRRDLRQLSRTYQSTVIYSTAA
jgi:tetratricopeptide (TPR) repeat protein